MLTRLTAAITTDRRAAAAAAVCAALLGCLIGLSVLLIAGGPRAASAEPPCIVTTSPGVPCPNVVILGTSTPAPVEARVLTQAISVYGAPDTATLIGPVEAGRAFAPVAVSADGQWLRLDVAGSGLVWTTAASVAGVDAAALAVIAPPAPTSPPAPIAEQPQQQTIYVTQPQAAPPTADLCTAATCDPAAAPTVCAANACWSAAAPDVVYVPAFGERGQRAAEPQPGDPGFADSFRDPQDVAFDASFRDPGCSQFIGYLPGDPCYRAP